MGRTVQDIRLPSPESLLIFAAARPSLVIMRFLLVFD